MHLCLSSAEGGGVITGFVHFKALTSTKFSLQVEMRVGFQAEEKTTPVNAHQADPSIRFFCVKERLS